MKSTLLLNTLAALRVELLAAKSAGDIEKAGVISQKMFKLMADILRAKKKISK